MYCPHCGRNLPNRANFCDKCGTAIDRAAPFCHMTKDGRFLRIDDRGILYTRFDRSTRRILSRELHTSRFLRIFAPGRQKRALQSEFDRLAAEAPDILANMTGGQFFPDADIVTVRVLFYPGDPEYSRLYPRNYLSILTHSGTYRFELPWQYRLKRAELFSFIRFFPEKSRGVLLLDQPLNL